MSNFLKLLLLTGIMLSVKTVTCNTLSIKEKNALELINAIKEMQYIEAACIITKEEIEFNEQGKFKSKHFKLVNTSPYINANSNENNRTITFDYFNGNLYGARIKSGSCGSSSKIGLFFNGDQIVKANFSSSDYDLEFNKNGKLIKATSGSSRYSGYIIKKQFQLFYDKNGEISEIKEYVIKGKGKTPREVKKFFTYLKSSKVYEKMQSKDLVKIHFMSYKDKSNNKEDDTLIKNETVTINLTDQKNVFEFIDNLTNEKITTYSLEYDEKGLLISKIHQSFKYKTRVEIIYSYNDTNWCINEIIKEFNSDNSVLNHAESVFTYELLEGKKPEDPCSYKKKIFRRIFDANGEVIKEYNERKTRMKNENGEWGPWTELRY